MFIKYLEPELTFCETSLWNASQNLSLLSLKENIVSELVRQNKEKGMKTADIEKDCGENTWATVITEELRFWEVKKKKNWLHCFFQKDKCLKYRRGIEFLTWVRARGLWSIGCDYEVMLNGLLKIQVEVSFNGRVCVLYLCFLLIMKVINNYSYLKNKIYTFIYFINV